MKYFKNYLFIIIAICIIVTMFFTGCKKTTPEPPQITPTQDKTPPPITPTQEPIKEYTVGDKPEVNNPIIRPEKLGDPTVIEFDLGTEYIKENNKDIPYQVQGAMGIPEGDDRHPIVFVVHGSHPVFNEEDVTAKRYDLGFKYLLEELASYGYLAVSINVNLQYGLVYGEPTGYERLQKIYNVQLEKLKEAVGGKDIGYGADLKDRGDLEDTTLIGHSRSGQGVYAIYNNQMEKGNNNIKRFFLIAPINFMVMDATADVPTGIIIPELDGDVRSLDGQRFFDDFRIDENRKSLVSLVYLYGANHNFFNTSLESDDSKGLRYRKPYDKKLSDIEQQDFLKQYVIDFLTSINQNPISSIGFNINETAPGHIYGYKVLTSLTTTQSKIILRPDSDESVNKNLLEAENIAQDVKVSYEVDSSFYKEDSSPFEHAGNPKYIGMLNLSWEKKGASFITTLPDSVKDISGYSALSLYIAVDPANDLNPKDTNQSLTIRIKDNNGNYSKVLVDPSAPAMTHAKGELIENEYADFWSTYSPLSSLRIPIKYFQGVDLTSINSIEILFDQTDSGALMLGEIALLR